MLPNRLSHSRTRPSLQKTSRSTARGFFVYRASSSSYTATRPFFTYCASCSSHTATGPFFSYCASSSSYTATVPFFTYYASCSSHTASVPFFTYYASCSSHTASVPFCTYCASSSSSFINSFTGRFTVEPYRRGLKKASSRRNNSCPDLLKGRIMAAIAAKEIQSVITLPLRTKLVKLPFGQ